MKTIYSSLTEAIENKDRCPNCNGTGTVVVLNVKANEDKEMVCPICEGTGNIMLEDKGNTNHLRHLQGDMT